MTTISLAAERLLYLSLRVIWREVRWPAPIRQWALHRLVVTGLGQRIATVLDPVPPVHFLPESMKDKRALRHYNSSTYGKLRPYPRPAAQHYDAVERRYRSARKLHIGPARIAFLTALTGRYEATPRHEHLIGDADYHLVTDVPPAMPGGSIVHLAEYFDRDPVRAARFVKTHPHLVAPHAKLAIWHDANVIIRHDLRPLISAFVESGKPVGVVPHPLRSSIAEEAEECIKRGKDDAGAIRDQLARYQALSFETGSLVESNFMMFRLDLPVTRRFLATWWNEIERGSRRDQLSLNFAADMTGTELFRLTSRPNSVRNHPLLALIQHDANVVPDAAPLPLPKASSFAAVRRERLKPQQMRTVDVVICVHNALQATRECLESVEKHRDSARHRIIVVDDGSSEETKLFLLGFVAQAPNTKLIRHDIPAGYTKAVNAGLRMATRGDLVILLNSDTIVSEDFAVKMADAVFTTRGAGIVGPLSNAASTQSLPAVGSTAEQTAINRLPDGMTPADLDMWCEQHSPATFPRVPLVHGFCFGLTRETIDKVGGFDEANFPRGYGEENDYCFRATAAGIGLVVATHTYVYHAKSQSYGSDERRALVEASNQRVKDLHGRLRVRHAVQNMQENSVLQEMRRAAAELYPSLDSQLPEMPPAMAAGPAE